MNSNEPVRDAALPELLAAYADGELDAASCARVESWLGSHPEASTDLENQRRLGWRHGRLWRLTAAAEPSDSTWAAALARLHKEVAAPRPARTTVWLPARQVLLAVAVLAATILVAFYLIPRSPKPSLGPAPAETVAFVVAGPDDVEIMRILEADTELLVVGTPPLPKPIILAALDDVEGLTVAKDTDGMMPMIAMQPGPNAPMIVAPVASK